MRCGNGPIGPFWRASTSKPEQEQFESWDEFQEPWVDWTLGWAATDPSSSFAVGLGNEGCRSTRWIGFFTDDCLLLQWGYR